MTGVDFRAKRDIKISGDVVGRDKIVNAIDIFIKNAHTKAEEARSQRELEREILAEAVMAFSQGLLDQVDRTGDVGGPYKGLLEYRLGDAELFFGRGQAVSELRKRLGRGPLTVLHAESGAGKTSLLKAGVSPHLIAAGNLPVHVRSYDANPSHALKRALLSELEVDAPGLASAPLRGFLQKVLGVLGPDTTLYVFLDQFEEFFTQLREPARGEFVSDLAECLNDDGLNVRWTLALRGEFFSNLANFWPRIRDPFENQYRLNRLNRPEAREVVIRPAEEQDISFETGLVERLLDDLGQDEAAPPQVQLVCLALYEELGSDETTITSQLYRALGGAAGILQGHLERVLKRDIPPHQRQHASQLLESLVTSERRRVRRTRQELSTALGPGRVHQIEDEALDAILGQLVDSRLLRAEEGDSSTDLVYELTHDYLAEQIELNPEVQARKAAQELLERETLNWELFGALMRKQTLQVVGAERPLLHIGEAASELLVKSAFETDLDLAAWLEYVPSDMARETLLDGLKRPEPELRTRAALHLARFFNEQVEANLTRCALQDSEPGVREAALETLAGRNPVAARQVLLASLEHQEAARRIHAAGALGDYLDPEAVEALFVRVRDDQSEAVWEAALETLARDEAEPYRAGWRPLLKAGLWRRVAVYHKLRALRVDLPRSLLWRLAPARAVYYLWREAQTRPLWSLARVALLVALYLGLAWFRGWPPFVRWEPVPGAPQERTYSMEVVDGRINYVGSQDYGLARHNADDSWSFWLRQGLPTGSPAKVNDPDSNVRAIEAIASDAADPDRVYVLVRENGLFHSEDAGETWNQIGAGQVPPNALTLDVMGKIILIAGDREGLYGSSDDGQTWQKLSGQNGLPGGESKVVRFDPEGVPYAGGADGLYRGLGRFPWDWEKVEGVPAVRLLEFGPDQRLYLALGWPASTQAVCYRPEGGLGAVVDFGFDIITALTAHLDDPDVFYVGTTSQVYALDCEGNRRELGKVPRTTGVTGLSVLPTGVRGQALIQANSAGLYQRRLR